MSSQINDHDGVELSVIDIKSEPPIFLQSPWARCLCYVSNPSTGAAYARHQTPLDGGQRERGDDADAGGWKGLPVGYERYTRNVSVEVTMKEEWKGRRLAVKYREDLLRLISLEPQFDRMSGVYGGRWGWLR